MSDRGRAKVVRLPAPLRDKLQATVRRAAQAPKSRHETEAGSAARFDFGRISIVSADDPSERVAEQLADQALSASPAPSGRPPATGRPAPASRPGSFIPKTGRPLDDATRAFMEPRFGVDFDKVRIHDGSAAAASARALGARAYAVGSDLVFGQSQYAPTTADGRRLLAHELAHVTQAGSDVGHTIHRQPQRPRKWAEIFQEFASARVTDPAVATALAKQLANTPPESDDLLDHGMEVVEWLDAHGATPTARRLLTDVRLQFQTGVDSEKLGRFYGVSEGLRANVDPGILIARGKLAARAGRHDDAFRFFGAANEILWRLINRVSQTPPHGLPDMPIVGTYPRLRHLYGRLREIYQFYFVLEAEARAARDTAGAFHAKLHGAALREELAKQYTPGGEAELSELTAVTTKEEGEALRLIGANREVLDITPLPGLEAPQEVASKSGGATQVAQVAELQTTLMNQEALQAEIGAVPEVRKAFTKGPIDLNDTAVRQTVWRIMYGVYKQRGMKPLESLMTLVGRYLKAYTHHTFYNIRDFGKNYLDTDFPVNLAGQIERDCGVYALTVAADVFETMKQVDPGVEITFSLRVMLDHIILVMEDKSTRQSYVVSNDRIVRGDPVALPPPRRSVYEPTLDENDSDYQPYLLPDVGALVTREYAAVRDLPFIVSPEVQVDLGSTGKTTGRKFHDDIWALYQKATKHASGVTKGVNKRLAAVNAKLPGGRGALASVFEAQQGLNNALLGLDARLASMEQLSGGDLAQAVDKTLVEAHSLLTLFEMIGRADKGPDPKHPIQVGLGKGIHPLVRFAALALRVQAQGGTLTATFPGTKDGKKATLTWVDFVAHIRFLFGKP